MGEHEGGHGHHSEPGTGSGGMGTVGHSEHGHFPDVVWYHPDKNDIPGQIYKIFIDLEEKTWTDQFTHHEIIHEAVDRGIDEEDAEEALEELIQNHYIHVLWETEHLLSRTVNQSYSLHKYKYPNI